MLRRPVMFCVVAWIMLGCGGDPGSSDDKDGGAGLDGGTGLDVNTTLDADTDAGNVTDADTDATSPDPDGGPSICTPPTGMDYRSFSQAARSALAGIASSTLA